MQPESEVKIEKFRGEKSKKRLKCLTEATAHQKEYFLRLKERVAQGEPLIWSYTGAPWLLFNSMDLAFVDSVWYSIQMSAHQLSQYYMDRLNNEEGYFRDVCRYCSVPLGYFFDKKHDIAPWGGLPKVTAAVFFHMDDPALKIWELYAREFNLPLFVMERGYMGRMPARNDWWEDIQYDAGVESYRFDLLVEEHEHLIRFLETHTGKQYSENRLREFIERNNRAQEWVWKGRDLALTAVPCPINNTDRWSLVNGFSSLGTEWSVDISKKWYEEVKERVDKGFGVCQPERVRLRWNFMLTWFSLGFYNTWEESHGAVFVPEDFVDGFNRSQTRIHRDLINPLRAVAGHPLRIVEGKVPPTLTPYDLYVTRQCKVDGVIYLTVESCKLLSAGIAFSKEAHERAGIPVLDISADMVDNRDWDDTKMKSLVTSFIETLMP